MTSEINNAIARRTHDKVPWAANRIGPAPFYWLLSLWIAAALWLQAWPYRGIVDDSGYYSVAALQRLGQGAYSADPYLKYGSQGRFTLFGWVYEHGIAASVYSAGGLDLLWLKFRRSSYWSCDRGVGALFFPGTAIDYDRRAWALQPLSAVQFFGPTRRHVSRAAGNRLAESRPSGLDAGVPRGT